MFRGEFNWFMFKVYLEKINGVRIFEFIFSCIFTRQHAQQSQFEYVNTTTSQTACNCKVISLKHIYQEVIDKLSNFRLALDGNYIRKLKIQYLTVLLIMD